MKRTVFLALVVTLMAAPALLAQQPAQQPQAQPPEVKKPKPVDPADVATLTGQPGYAAEPEAAPKPGHPLAGEPAPKKGHPLDPRDVDILTGKADRSAQQPAYAPPYLYGYGGVNGYGSRFGYSRFTGGSTRTSPLPFPRVFRGSLPFPTFLLFR